MPVAVAYVLVFLLLDWVSFIRPYQGLNITPWNPQPALAIALLVWRPRSLGVVWLGIVAADLVVRGWPADSLALFAVATALTFSYGAIGRWLRGRLDPALALATRRDLAWLTAASAGGALLSGVLFVGAMAAAGLGPEGRLVDAIARYWIGDAVGLVVLLPMLLIALDPRRRLQLVATLRAPSWWAIVVVAVALILIVFHQEDRDRFKYFYLLFLPVVWASARLGLAGAILSAAFTQLGVIVAVQLGSNPDLTVFELQVLVTALTMTGLMLGVAVDERRAAEERLLSSLRLAAAGQMAAALAHELSQPLTALNGYAQAARLLTRSDAMPADERLARLSEVATRMADDAVRASDVVKRLRDFFRSGSTQLRRTSLARLVEDAVAAAAARAQAQGIRLVAAPAVPVDVLVDPVQVAVVLRNLLANALDAASASPAAGQVEILTQRIGDECRIRVRDNGPGLEVSRLQRLFEPGASDKPGGMGIGLSICRAIVEAHGGRLWAEPGPPATFCLTLPADVPESGPPSDAP